MESYVLPIAISAVCGLCLTYQSYYEGIHGCDLGAWKTLFEDHQVHIEAKMQSSLSGFVLVVSGAAAMLLAASVDLIYARNNGFGLQQLSILIAGLIVALAGVRTLVYPRHKIPDWALLIVYFAGILFMGLKPSSLDGHRVCINGVLGIEAFSRLDFGINILGFVPLSYLIMSCLDTQSDRKPGKRMILLALCFGFGVSLCLEILQHSIPGRFSSLNDFLANGLGTLTGIAFYLAGRVWETRKEITDMIR